MLFTIKTLLRSYIVQKAYLGASNYGNVYAMVYYSVVMEITVHFSELALLRELVLLQ